MKPKPTEAQLLGTIRIPGRTASQNEVKRMGTWKERKAKRKWREDAYFLSLSIGKLDPPGAKRKIILTSYRKRLLDCAAESLAGGACKHYVDGLVDAGVLVDDSERWCEREYRQVAIKDSALAKGLGLTQERLEIEVWSLPAEALSDMEKYEATL